MDWFLYRALFYSSTQSVSFKIPYFPFTKTFSSISDRFPSNIHIQINVRSIGDQYLSQRHFCMQAGAVRDQTF